MNGREGLNCPTKGLGFGRAYPGRARDEGLPRLGKACARTCNPDLRSDNPTLATVVDMSPALRQRSADELLAEGVHPKRDALTACVTNRGKLVRHTPDSAMAAQYTGDSSQLSLPLPLQLDSSNVGRPERFRIRTKTACPIPGEATARPGEKCKVSDGNPHPRLVRPFSTLGDSHGGGYLPQTREQCRSNCQQEINTSRVRWPRPETG